MLQKIILLLYFFIYITFNEIISGRRRELYLYDSEKPRESMN